MDPMHTAAYRVLQDIPEAGYLRGDLVVLQLEEGPGARGMCPEALELIRWIGRGWVEQVALRSSSQRSDEGGGLS